LNGIKKIFFVIFAVLHLPAKRCKHQTMTNQTEDIIQSIGFDPVQLTLLDRIIPPCYITLLFVYKEACSIDALRKGLQETISEYYVLTGIHF
jgi:hypothetical protein